MDTKDFKPSKQMENKPPKKRKGNIYSRICSVYFNYNDPVLMDVYKALMKKYPPTRSDAMYPNVTRYLKEHASQIIEECNEAEGE